MIRLRIKDKGYGWLWLWFFRLAERQTFQTTGLATIRLRYSGFKEGKGKLENVKSRLQISLNETTGKELKEKIAGNVGVPVNGLKLIAAGKVVDEGKNLESQNVKNGSQIMVLSVAADHESLQVGWISRQQGLIIFFDCMLFMLMVTL